MKRGRGGLQTDRDAEMVKLFFFLLSVWVVVQGSVPGNPALMYKGSALVKHFAVADAGGVR